jgi:TRAP-type mannitol/chloroaromatic compound transport system permease small subunit
MITSQTTKSDGMMRFLLRVSGAIDAVNECVGRLAYWLVLVAVLVSTVNAVMRYTLSMSSNAWLELQWYLFAAVFLLGAAYTLKANGHVRIDLVSARLTPRAQAWIDIVGTVLFLLPMALVILYFSWPMFVDSYVSGEVSSDAGGLVRWPVKALIPAGFALLVLQALSEIVKRVAFLSGATPPAPAPEREPH